MIRNPLKNRVDATLVVYSYFEGEGEGCEYRTKIGYPIYIRQNF